MEIYTHAVVAHQIREMVADISREFDVLPSHVRSEIRAEINLQEARADGLLGANLTGPWAEGGP